MIGSYDSFAVIFVRQDNLSGPGLLLLCHGDFPEGFLENQENHRLYMDCCAAMESLGDKAGHASPGTAGNELSMLSSAIVSVLSRTMPGTPAELAFLGLKAPGIRKAVYRTVRKGSRTTICIGAGGLMLPGSGASLQIPSALCDIKADNPGMNLIFASHGFNHHTVSDLIMTSIEHGLGGKNTMSRPTMEVPSMIADDVGAVIVSAPDYCNMREGHPEEASKLLGLSRELSLKSKNWHSLMRDVPDFMTMVSYSLLSSGKFSAVEAGYIDFATPGVAEAMQKLQNADPEYIIAVGTPSLLHRHPFSYADTEECIEQACRACPDANIVYIKPDPGPVFGVLADLTAVRLHHVWRRHTMLDYGL